MRSSSSILLEYPSLPPYPLIRQHRSAAVPTTSAEAPSISQRRNPYSANNSPISSPLSSSKLTIFTHRCSCFCCRLSRGSVPLVPDENDDFYVYLDGGGENDIDDEENEDDDDSLVDFLADGKTEELLGNDGVFIEIKKMGKNSRRVRSKIGIEASLDAVWSVLTSYEKLSDYIPALVASELVEKKGNRARIFQIGQQNLALGLKFNAKAVLDCYEKELEILPHGKKRDIEFTMVEGDFQLFEGKWSIEQFVLCS